MATRLKADVRVVTMNIPEGNALFAPLKMAAFFRSEKPHIVHCHGFAGGSYLGIVGARLAGVPVVINGEHGSFFLKPHQILMQKILASMCDEYLSVSATLKKKVADNLRIDPGRISVIPNGVDTDIFNGNYDTAPLREELAVKYGISIGDESFIIGSIGSLKPEKNQGMLLEAVARVEKTKEKRTCVVIFIGDGPDLPALQDLVREKGLQKQVAFLGVRDDVSRWLALMDLFVSTSIARHEGLSNVILEAMASGLPVVSTRSVGSAELVHEGSNGFLIEPDDVAQLSDRLGQLMSDRPLLIQMGCNATDFIRQGYSIERMISAYERLYHKALEHRRS